jgi:uncharacterized phage protein gp47/JayE
MSYVARLYPEIVRDLLTTLTGGTVRESITVPSDPNEALLPTKLQERPVRRVSYLEGVLPNPDDPSADGPTYRFTTADFELVAPDDDPDNKSMIRFRDDGRRPKPGSTLTVNYYPAQTPPVPLTDLNVGSVARTMIETFARELALGYQQLEHVYKSAYLDTADGSSLDKVVALVGVARRVPGAPQVELLVERSPNVGGQITLPANSAITDDDGTRYLTLTPLTLEPYESSRKVLARGETSATPLVDAGKLTRLETLVAGVGKVSNPNAAYTLTAPESDDDLRRRARSSLETNARGTLDALRFGLLAIDGVKDVAITEHPNGVAGEIKIDVAYAADAASVLPFVQRRVEELRPAGVRVLPIGEAAKRRLTVGVALTLAGSGVGGAELDSLKSSAQARLDAYFKSVAAGGMIRRSQMLAKLIEDQRIADAVVTLTPETGDPLQELQLDTGEVLEIQGYNFSAPTSEQAAAVQLSSTVGLSLPVTLAAGITQAEATTAIDAAFTSHLAQRAPDRPLTADGIIAALRDDTRYAILRAGVVASVERSDSTFVQLTDGTGTYAPADGETMTKGTLDISVQEGA